MNGAVCARVHAGLESFRNTLVVKKISITSVHRPSFPRVDLSAVAVLLCGSNLFVVAVVAKAPE